MKLSKYFLLFILLISQLFSQNFDYKDFQSARYARTIRLGDVFTGVANSTETVHYNPAGLVNIKNLTFLYSNGSSLPYPKTNYSTQDYIFAAKMPDQLGAVAFSYNYFNNVVPSDTSNYQFKLYSLHYGNYLNDNFSYGISINYYSGNIDVKNNSGSANSFDINLSVLYNLPNSFKINEKDIFNLGFIVKNIFDSKYDYSNFNVSGKKFQQMRLGTSYLYNPQLTKIFDRNPLTIMLASDLVVNMKGYKIETMNPNFAIELSLLEMIQVSFANQSESVIKDGYIKNLEFPVTRYGFGVILPLDKLFNLQDEIEVKFDYALSKWKNNFSIINDKIVDNVYSFQINMVL